MSSQEKGGSSDHKVNESSPLNILPSIFPSLYFLLSVAALFICPSSPPSGLFFHLSFLICLFTPVPSFHLSLSLSPSFSLPPSLPLFSPLSIYAPLSIPLYLYFPPLSVMGYKCCRTDRQRHSTCLSPSHKNAGAETNTDIRTHTHEHTHVHHTETCHKECCNCTQKLKLN